MKFSIEKKDIASKIAHLVTVVPSKNAMAILTRKIFDNRRRKFGVPAIDLQLALVLLNVDGVVG